MQCNDCTWFIPYKKDEKDTIGKCIVDPPQPPANGTGMAIYPVLLGSYPGCSLHSKLQENN